MGDQAPPQFSPDGYWWWTGRRWVPVQQPGSTVWSTATTAHQPPAGAQPARTSGRRGGPRVLWLALIALAVLLTLAFFPDVTAWVSQRLAGVPGTAATAPPASAPATAPPATAPPPPAPTSSDASGAVAAYQQLILSEEARFQSAGQSVASRCSPRALAGGTASCRAALQSLDDTVQSIQSDLNSQPVPDCLQPVDRQVRSALTLYHQGIQQELDGLDSSNPLAVVQGAGTLSRATGEVRSASALLSSSCQ